MRAHGLKKPSLTLGPYVILHYVETTYLKMIIKKVQDAQDCTINYTT